MSTSAPPVSSAPLALGRARLPRIDSHGPPGARRRGLRRPRDRPRGPRRRRRRGAPLPGERLQRRRLDGLGQLLVRRAATASSTTACSSTRWPSCSASSRWRCSRSPPRRGLFAVIVMHQWGRPARWSALLFALSAPALLAAGQYPFALGTAFSLLALLAAQRGRPWLLVAAALATALSSPLAFAFLVVTLGGLLLGGGRTSALRSARVAFPLCAILLMLAAEVAVYQAFPGGGPFPYPAADLIGITAFSLCGLAARARIAAHAPARRAVPRLPRDRLVGEAVPVAARRQRHAPARLRGRAAARARDRGARRRRRARSACSRSRSRSPGRRRRSSRTSPTRSASRPRRPRYWQPVIGFLHQPGRHDPANFRVEVVATARHYESYYLTRGEGEAIPRGWYRQNDFPTNGVLYDRTISAARVPALAAPDGRPLRVPADRRARRVREAPRPRCCAAGSAGCARSRSRRTSAPSSCRTRRRS